MILELTKDQINQIIEWSILAERQVPLTKAELRTRAILENTRKKEKINE